jgi:hypothetical protein
MFASVLVAGNAEDRHHLTDHVFDFQNYTFKSDFKNINKRINQVIDSVAELQGAYVVGSLPSGNKQLTSTFMYASLVKPGKHSLFIYDPTTDRIYQKIIALDIEDSFRPRELNTNGDNYAVYQKGSIRNIFPLNEKRPESVDIEAFFIASNPSGTFDIRQYFEQKDHECVMDVYQSMNTHFKEIITLYREMQSECLDGYPNLSFQYLRGFCQTTGLVDVARLDETLEVIGNVKD